MNPHPTLVWSLRLDARVASCSMAITCSGVELQVVEQHVIVRRERHPDRSIALERAALLREEFGRAGYVSDRKLRRA